MSLLPSRIKDRGSRIKYQVSRIKDLGPGMNDHPGRDTNVRSRPSESTIKDLSFYTGFIRIGSSIKHLEPCFGMNDHPGRDTDVISRPSKSTIKDLSFYIGFTRIGSSYKDRIKDLGPWTLSWHEWPF